MVFLCTFCSFVLAGPIYSTIRHCCKSFRKIQGTQRSLQLRNSQSPESADTYQHDCILLRDCNFNVACKTGIRYSAYDIMCHRESQAERGTVRPSLDEQLFY